MANANDMTSELRERSSQIGERIRTGMERMPKPIDPRTHCALDYLTTSAFMLMAGYFWNRNKRAGILALVNGLGVLGITMITDYTGSRFGGNAARILSFKQHRTADIAQAGMAAVGPTLLGFGGQAASLPFRLQAANEGMVVALTNWDAGGRGRAGQMPGAAEDIAA